MPDCDVLDVLVLAADVAHCGFETAWKTNLSCLELHPRIFELVASFVVLICMSIVFFARVNGQRTRDCQLSSMMRLLILISFLASDSSASKSFCSLRCCPMPFHVQYESPSSGDFLLAAPNVFISKSLTPIFQPLWLEVVCQCLELGFSLFGPHTVLHYQFSRMIHDCSDCMVQFLSNSSD